MICYEAQFGLIPQIYNTSAKAGRNLLYMENPQPNTTKETIKATPHSPQCFTSPTKIKSRYTSAIAAMGFNQNIQLRHCSGIVDAG